jgi:PhnB protein
MSQQKLQQPIAQSVVPHLVCDDAAAAIEFYKKAFSAEELMRLPGKNGRLMHACIKIGNSCVFLVDAMTECGALSPKALNGSPVTVHLNVPDVDATMASVIAAGATVEMTAADMFWGDRYGRIIDPFGHHWSVATHLRDLTPAEIQAAAVKFAG